MREKIERTKQREQDAKVRAHNFEEVCNGYTLEQAKVEASRCLQCRNPLCMLGCPVSVRIPEFIAQIVKGDFDKASDIIKSTNSLPSVCGRVCPQENQCEKNCVRAKLDGAVAIGALERFVGDRALNSDKSIEKVALRTDKKVAVIGSGPSSLACAGELINHGVKVTMYEAFHKAGGVLVYGIPEFRLPKELVRREIETLVSKGVEIKLNMVAGRSVTIEQLRSQYDAVFIGSGAGLPVFMHIAGENLNGVYSANEYLTRVNLMKAYQEDSRTPVQRGKNVVVLGAGNVAMDSARTALRLGAESVTVVYRRGREEMPARKEEICHAEQEGIVFELLTSPIEILGENGRASAITCQRMELGEPDASGRRSPKVIANSEFTLATDMVIVAIGTSANPLIKSSYADLPTTKKGTIIVNEDTMETSVPNLYAGGDAVTGAATVILAMGAGRKASRAILTKFGITD